MIDISSQIKDQEKHAKFLIEMGACKGPLTLVLVEYPGMEPRVSIIGHAIVNSVPELWEAHGAKVTVLREIGERQC